LRILAKLTVEAGMIVRVHATLKIIVSLERSRWQFTHSARWPGSMNCKTYKIRTAWDTGDRLGALRMAARSSEA
jgi:hypothetical protein